MRAASIGITTQTSTVPSTLWLLPYATGMPLTLKNKTHSSITSGSQAIISINRTQPMEEDVSSLLTRQLQAPSIPKPALPTEFAITAITTVPATMITTYLISSIFHEIYTSQMAILVNILFHEPVS